MSIFGHYIDNFLDNTINIENIYHKIENIVSEMFNDLTTNVYHFSLLDDNLRSLINAYNEILPLLNNYYQIIDNHAIGFYPDKIQKIYIGNEADLLKTIPEDVFRDTYFISSLSTLIKIKQLMNTHSLYNFNQLVISNPYKNRKIIYRFFPIITESYSYENYFSLCYESFQVFDALNNRKNAAIYLLLTEYLNFFFSNSNYSVLIYRHPIDPPLINSDILINQYTQFVDAKYTEISSALYSFLYNNFLVLRDETNLFKNINTNAIRDFLRQGWINVISSYFSKHRPYLTPIRVIFDTYKLYTLNIIYRLLVDELYTNYIYNTDYLEVDYNFLEDAEQYISDRIQLILSQEYSDYLTALQYYAIQFRLDPVYFLNSEIFLHYYFINNLIFDKKFTSFDQIFQYNFRDITAIRILNSVQLKDDLRELILDYFLNSKSLLRHCVKISLCDYLSPTLFDFYESPEFRAFLVDLTKECFAAINRLYYLESDEYKITEVLISFFKSVTLYYILVQDSLFNLAISSIENFISNIINSVEFIYSSTSDLVEDYIKFRLTNAKYLLSNFYFSARMAHYLHLVLDPLKLDYNKLSNAKV